MITLGALEHACDAGYAPRLMELKACKTLEEAWAHPYAPAWAFHMLDRTPGLPAEDRRALVEKVCEDPGWAALMRVFRPGVPEEHRRMAEEAILRDPGSSGVVRRDAKDLPEPLKRALEAKALEDPEWAFDLRMNVRDLPDDVRHAAELKACEDNDWACWLAEYAPDMRLHPDTIARLAELGFNIENQKEH